MEFTSQWVGRDLKGMGQGGRNINLYEDRINDKGRLSRDFWFIVIAQGLCPNSLIS